jgi:hypothetical protein
MKLRKKNQSKQTKLERDFPAIDRYDHYRKAVCKRCKCVLNDCEPCSPNGEFWHSGTDKDGKPHWCPNAGNRFSTRDMELIPFMPKSRRRQLKRLEIRP